MQSFRIHRFLMALVVSAFLLPSRSYAQKEVLYEQYIQNPMAINPAFTGVRQDFNMSVLLRRRWFLIPNAPITQTFAMDGTVANGKVGLGLQALNDRMSPYYTTGVYGSAAYHWDASVTWKVSLGVQGGINVLPVYDFASGTSLNRALGSFGVGVWIHSDEFYLGISKPELLSQGYGDRQNTFEYSKPLYVTGGATFQPTDQVKITPSLLLVQESGQKLRIDVGGRLWYDEKVGVGAFYRMARVNYVQLSAEAQLGRNVRLGYIYNSRAIESSIVGINNNPISIHEVMLKFVPNPSGFHLN
jgi:type IX secretion system PorP/SprF family membrane protein